jgi:hypothetical protein
LSKLRLAKEISRSPQGDAPYIDQENQVYTISAFIFEEMSINFISSYLKNKKLFLSNKRMGNFVK